MSSAGSSRDNGPSRRSRRPARTRLPKPPLMARWISRAAWTVLVAVVVSLTLALVGVGFMFSAYSKVKGNIDAIVNIELPQGSQATRIYARDYDPKTQQGTLLGLIFAENRQNAHYSEVPPMLIACVLSTEDKNFYHHKGVDLGGTLRAVAKGITRGGNIRGTSTLTQQLARNVFLPFIKSERTLNRKVQEFILAGALEKRFSKQEILEAYMNHVYFGHHAYGAKAAARTYFDKSLDELTLSECAQLAGLPQLPDKNDPYKNPEGAESRRQSVLKLLRSRLNSGFFAELKRADPDKFSELKVTADEIKQALDEKPQLRHELQSDRLFRAQYFVEEVRKELKDEFGGEQNVNHQGLAVVTTIDPRIQSWAEQILKANIDKDRKNKNVSQGAVIVIEAKTGEVLACAGGYQWHAATAKGPDELNRAMMNGRQTGSSFKPFTYSTAYEQGFPCSLVLYDGPYKPETERTGKPWPNNSDHRYLGYLSMYYALEQSRNAAAVDLMNNCTGIKPVIETARRMGITADLPEVPALTLGVANIKPVEMAEAFDTFPNMGKHVDSITIKKIYNSSGILIEPNDSQGAIDKRSNMAFSPNTAYWMARNMQLVVNAGTGTAARVSGVEIAGKTGTCDDFGDAWFVGYSPEIVCAVWVGNDDFQNKMHRMFGGNTPAATFQGIMSKIYGKDGIARYKQRKFIQPPGCNFNGFHGAKVIGGGPGGEKKKDDTGAEGEGGADKGKDNGFYDPWSPPSDGHVFF